LSQEEENEIEECEEIRTEKDQTHLEEAKVGATGPIVPPV
jgi:hypothetical protein